jgi:hypothetical protein
MLAALYEFYGIKRPKHQNKAVAEQTQRSSAQRPQ